MHDAIVIGARCAGATTAMLLARGLDVLLGDRAAISSAPGTFGDDEDIDRIMAGT